MTSFSADGHSLLAGYGLQPARLWDVRSGLISAILQDSAWTDAVAIVGDRNWLVATQRNVLGVWLNNGQLLGKAGISPCDRVRGMTMTPAGQLVIVCKTRRARGAKSGKLAIHKIPFAELTAALRPDKVYRGLSGLVLDVPAQEIVLSADGSWVAAAGPNKIRAIRLSHKTKIQFKTKLRIKSIRARGRPFALSPNAKFLALSEPRGVKFLRFPSGASAGTMRLPNGITGGTQIRFGPRGRWVYTVNKDRSRKEVMVSFDRRKKKVRLVKPERRNTGSAIDNFIVSPQGPLALSHQGAQLGGLVLLIDPQNGRWLNRLQGRLAPRAPHITITSQGDLLFGTASYGEVRIWDIARGLDLSANLPGAPPKFGWQPTNATPRYAVSKDGDWLTAEVRSGDSSGLYRRKLRGSGAWQKITSRKNTLYSDGTRVITRKRGGALEAYNIKDGTVAWKTIGGVAHKCKFGPQAKFVACQGTDRRTTRILQLTDGKEVFREQGKWIGSTMFSPDGRYFGAFQNKGSKKNSIYETATGKQVYQFRSRSYAQGLTWDAKSETLVHEARGTLMVVRTADWSVAGKIRVSMKLHGHAAQPFIIAANGKTVFFVEAKVRGYQGPPSTTRILRAYSTTTGKELRSATAPTYARDLQLTPNGRLLISSDIDSTTRIWRTKDLSLVASLAGYAGDYVLVAPEGEYATTGTLTRSVAFRAGANVYPYEQFDTIFNRPDRVYARLAIAEPGLLRAYGRARERRIRRLGVKDIPIEQAFDVPKIEIVNTNIPLSTRKKYLSISVHATAEHAPLAHLLVLNSSVPVLKLTAKGTQDTRTVKVPLHSGLNRIEIFAEDTHGRSSLRRVVFVNRKAPRKKPTLFVGAIGVSDYDGEELDLLYASKDAQDLTELLKGSAKSYARVKTKVLIDAAVSRTGLKAVADLFAKADVDDTVVLFVAGHGMLDDQDAYYYATSGIDPEFPAKAGIGFDELIALVTASPAHRRVVIMDTCHSGDVDRDAQVEVTELNLPNIVLTRGIRRKSKSPKANTEQVNHASRIHLDAIFADLRRDSGATVIASASGLQLAFESGAVKNGVFTYALMENLRGFATHLSTIPLDFTIAWLLYRVSDLTGGLQTPTLRRANYELEVSLR